MNIPWKDQYKHPSWQKKRLEALEYAEFSCESCGDSESQLHVHHRQYFKGRKIWEYELIELLVLCEPCHEEAHQLNDKLKAALATTSATMEQIIGYIEAFEMLTGDPERHYVTITSHEHAEGFADCLRVKTKEVITAAQEHKGAVSECMFSLKRKE